MPLVNIIVFNSKTRAVDKREYLVIIRDNCLFCIKSCVVIPDLNCETVQMRGHNI